MKRAKKGFTLVEVIVVLVIIAIVAAIAVPNISGYIKRSKTNNCQHTMNDFVNDLEYRIVSKRYYDVNELNNELVGLVEAVSDSRNADANVITSDGKFQRLEEKIKEAAGICPNGGQYTVEWTIKPGDDPNTAKVKIGKCECDCIDEHVQLSSSYEFTAALIDTSEYLKSGRAPEEIYETEIEKLVKKYNTDNSHLDPASVDDIVDKINENSEYKILGMTVSQNPKINGENNVEWMLVDHHEDYDANDPENKPGTHKFFVYYPSEDRMEIFEMSEEDYKDKKKWPPAEGNSGSYIYSEKLSYSNGQTYQVAGVDHPEMISWIQRDGDWYVEKTDYSKGIDDLENSRPENPEEHILISRKIPESITVESLLDSEALAPDTRNLMLINVSYKNETGTTKFLRMEASEDGSTVKNGFVIVSSEEEYRDKKWAGVYADSTSPEAIAELNTRKEILGKENTLVRDFFSGKTNKLVVAYQEYNKVYNKTTDRYEVKPVTCFSEIVMSQRADGVKEIKTGDEVIATIEAVPGKTSDYNIFFDSALLEGDVFRVEDLSIKRTAEYVIKNTNGDTVGKALVGEEIPHVSKAAEGEVGFFVNGNYPQTQPANYIYNKETEDNSVDHINHGNGQGFIYILDPSDKYNYEQIGRIETYEHGGYLEWNYDKEENDTEFDINKLTATVKYKVNVRDKSDTPVSTGWITYEYGHKTDADSYGFYFVTKNGDTSWNSDNDSRLYSELNDRYAAVEVRIDYCKYYNSDYPNRVNEHLCDIISYFDSVKATYTNDGSSFDFEKIKAEAGYRIALCHYYGQSPVYTIDHSVELSHDSEADNKFRYYMTMQHHDPSLQELQTQEYAFLSQLYGDYKGETFVAFNDKNIDGNKVTKKASIYVDSTSEINPPEVVYIPFSGTQDAYAVAYIGNSKAVTVEPSYEGYWSETAPDASVNSGFIKRTVNNKDYYYIDDRKTYNITRIGKDPDGDEYSFEFPKTDNITSFTVSSGVKEIGSGAFHNYGYKFKWGEAVIVLPDSVKKIGKNAFSGLNIGNIITGNISKSVADDGSVVKASGTSLLESIGDGSFSGTTLFACDAFVVPEKVTSIGTGAFTDFKIGNGGLFIDGVSDASEKSIAKDVFGGTVFGRLSFGPGVEKIESDAFKNNTSSAVLELGSVKSIGENAFNGWINANGDLIIPESVEKIGGFAFSDYASGQNNSANYHSLTINGGSFSDGTKLGGLIFTNGHFRDISIGGKVTDIDENAFSNAPLDGKMPYNELKGTLTLGSSISTIGTAAFKDCTGLNGNLDLPDRQLNEIGDSAFEGCFGFNGDLTVPDTVTRIGNSTFENCTGFTGNLDLGSSIQTIGSSAFKNCKGFKGDLVVPESVTNMGERAFDSYAAALTDSSKYPSLTVNAGDSNDGLNLGGLIFTNGHFRNVYVGGKITNIGDYAFDNESNEHSDFTGLLTIGNNVEVIGDYAFKKCTGFTGKLGFSENKVLNRIENEAFVDCTGFTGELDLPDSIQEIGSKAFENCTGFDGDIDLGSSLKTVGIEAFKNCTGFTGDLTVPESVTAMGKGAFENYAAALENSSRYPSLTVYAGHTENGTKLGPFIFTNAHFRNVHIGGKIKVIDDYAFSNSESNGSEPYSCFVGSLRIDGDVEKIGEEAFKQCTGFDESLYVGDSVKEIDNSAFREMHINELTGLSGVKRIGRYAFWKCDKIASDVTFEGNTSLERIEREAFYGTSSLGSLTIPPTVTFMGPYAFDNSGSGNGRLVIFGASRIENGKKYLGDNKYSGQPDSGGTLFNHARYRDVIIGGNVDVIGQYFMKSDFSRTDGSYDTNFDHHGITGSLTITGNVSEIEGEAFNDAGFDGTLTLNSSKLETIGYSAFENLPNMYGDITIPQTVHNIDRRAFKKFAMNAPDSKLGTLRIKGYSESNGNQHIIGYRLFSFARFKSVEIGGENSSVNTIGNFAFYNSSF
ncbi:leucine-rich repeat domain-containing protein [Ruminococcus sp. HUN007]|uniref:leucine-rich repeat domain-containing protein n=1 Tax=Ruminococcus sp. HUN007 TaxID=1514668 RepID=UPI0005D1C3DD|nr:leucine-rich repeat domain-containing protein [Ruminococcus sp. HUN007]